MIADVTGRQGLALGATLAALLVAAPSATAHDLERTVVSLTFASDGTFVLDVANDPDWLLLRLEPFAAAVSALRATAPATVGRLDAAPRDRRLAELGSVFIDRLVLFVDGREVRPASAEYLGPRTGTMATYRLRGHLPLGASTLRWFYGIVADPYPFVVTRADGATSTEWIAGAMWSGTVTLAAPFGRLTRWGVVKQYLALGYTHILPKGVDHMLFVLGIFLLSPRVKTMLLQVTAFTVAHSITLGLTMYGIVSLSPRIVEPLIALSIAYVAIENLVTTELRPWRLALVFAFGLLHGMGFAGVLRELGLPREQFLTALLTFNLGVEAGQLTVIATAGLCVFWFRHREWYRRVIVVPASLLIAAIGVYWTVARVMGIR